MSISTPPPPVRKKKWGLGCLGCGCLVLALLALLFFGAVGGIFYLGYTEIIALTSTTPAAVPSFNGDDDVFNAAKQKADAFGHDLDNHQAATLQLDADEINALIAHNPNLTGKKIRAFVTLTNDEGRIQGSFPTETISDDLIKGRYANFDTTFSVGFDSENKNIMLTFHTLQFGNETLMGGASDNSGSSFQQGFLRGFKQSFGPAFSQSFSNGIRKSPGGRALLDQAKSIEIKDGELVIETR